MVRSLCLVLPCDHELPAEEQDRQQDFDDGESHLPKANGKRLQNPAGLGKTSAS